MFDFNKYDDASLVNDYEGFIDQYGNFYKVIKRGEKIIDENGYLRDSHNNWAEAYMKEKKYVKNFNFKFNASALFCLSSLNGPAEFLVHCFGFTYYSHDPYYHKPIIKIPNPKIANYKVTEDQLDMLFSLMLLNKENVNIPIFFDDNEEYDYYGSEKQKVYTKI